MPILVRVYFPCLFMVCEKMKELLAIILGILLRLSSLVQGLPLQGCSVEGVKVGRESEIAEGLKLCNVIDTGLRKTNKKRWMIQDAVHM